MMVQLQVKLVFVGDGKCCAFFEFYSFDNLSDWVHWTTLCHWYVRYYEDIQGSILVPKGQDSERAYVKKSELYYVPIFYFCDWQDFIIFSDPPPLFFFGRQDTVFFPSWALLGNAYTPFKNWHFSFGAQNS